jgi:large subunit ribosomal protein L29
MSKQQISTIRSLSDQQLAEEENSTERELLNLRFQAATRQLSNPNELRKIRRKLAQVKTIAQERVILNQIGSDARNDND